jgi:hypothetical protein
MGPSAQATPASPAARGLPGRPVSARPDPAHAPRVGTGRFVVGLPARTAYLRLVRSAPGTTLHVGAQLVGHGGSVGEGFTVDVATSARGGACGSAVAFRPTLGEPAPVLEAATSTWTSNPSHPCSADRPLLLRIHAPTDADDIGRRLQLRVYEEPPVSADALSLLTTPSPPVWSDLEPGVAARVRPGHVVDDAPLVHDGTYAITIAPGEDDFLAVPAGWGDQLHVQLDTELPAALDPADPGLDLHLLGPLLDDADTGALGTDPEVGPTRDRRAYRTGVMSQDIDYVNRTSVEAGVSGADLAGVHYVALRYVPTAPGAGPLSVRLTVQTRPGDGAAPLYTELDGVPPPVADSRLVDGSLQDRPSAPARHGSSAAISEDRSFPWLSIVLALGGVVVLGGLVDLLVQVRRRR